jgi:hypothetical protein
MSVCVRLVQLALLGQTNGQLSGTGPRLIIDRGARERRMHEVRDAEEAARHAAWERRAAHRMGWADEGGEGEGLREEGVRLCSAHTKSVRRKSVRV